MKKPSTPLFYMYVAKKNVLILLYSKYFRTFASAKNDN